MNYGIHSNDNRDTGYEVARKTAEIILSCGGTPVFAKEFEGEFEAPEGTVFENFGTSGSSGSERLPPWVVHVPKLVHCI